MDILLNGESRTVIEPCRVSDLLRAEGLAHRRVAVEINGDIVPRSAHDHHVLHAGDQVEIVHALGGG
jgi:sulfur carrier protein